MAIAPRPPGAPLRSIRTSVDPPPPPSAPMGANSGESPREARSAPPAVTGANVGYGLLTVVGTARKLTRVNSPAGAPAPAGPSIGIHAPEPAALAVSGSRPISVAAA